MQPRRKFGNQSEVSVAAMQLGCQLTSIWSAARGLDQGAVSHLVSVAKHFSSFQSALHAMQFICYLLDGWIQRRTLHVLPSWRVFFFF